MSACSGTRFRQGPARRRVGESTVVTHAITKRLFTLPILHRDYHPCSYCFFKGPYSNRIVDVEISKDRGPLPCHKMAGTTAVTVCEWFSSCVEGGYAAQLAPDSYSNNMDTMATNYSGLLGISFSLQLFLTYLYSPNPLYIYETHFNPLAYHGPELRYEVY